MAVTHDPVKRQRALQERVLDFEDAAEIFDGETFEFEDVRRDYGEQRMVSIGFLRGRMVMVGYVLRGSDRHVYSMRKCNAREIKRYSTLLQQAGP